MCGCAGVSVWVGVSVHMYGIYYIYIHVYSTSFVRT